MSSKLTMGKACNQDMFSNTLAKPKDSIYCNPDPNENEKKKLHVIYRHEKYNKSQGAWNRRIISSLFEINKSLIRTTENYEI